MITILFQLLVSFSSADYFSETEMQAELNKYKDNPSQFFETLPPKKGLVISKFPEDDSWLEKKKTLQLKIQLQGGPRFLSAPGGNDKASNFMEDGPVVDNLKELDSKGVRQGASSVKPWSDDYWGYYKGTIAQRYADKNFPGATDWSVNFNFYQSSPLLSIFSSGNPSLINNLSPAEKYDLLVGGTNLTDYMWNVGQRIYNETGKVETWQGICHGWAPASYLVKRPNKSVTVTAHDGVTKIKLYPDDIKAITTALWANAKTAVKFSAGRCKVKNPPTDEGGRPTNPDCLDTNPASFHLIMANRVGLAKRSFVIDHTYDYEVWNQPIVGYKYFYFNPKTLDLVRTIDSATVRIEDFSNDKYRAFRHPDTKFIVGVKMQMTYGMERRPTHMETDGPQNDITTTVLLTYDLELDANGKVIGGEWYKKAHPDFLWTPVKDAQALARNDRAIIADPLWNGEGAMPESWQQNARESARYGQPLNKIVQSLLALSQ